MMKKKSRIYIIWLMNLCLITTVVAIFVWYESVPDVSPEKVLKTYMAHISNREYEQMYEMIDAGISGNISQEDFVKRNSAIYEGIDVDNMKVHITSYDKEQKEICYETSMDTVAGNVTFENKASFILEKGKYKLIWNDSLIFPELDSTDKVKVSTTSAKRGQIIDRNGHLLAGEGAASSIGVVPGELENKNDAISQLAELLEMKTEDIENQDEQKWKSVNQLLSRAGSRLNILEEEIDVEVQHQYMDLLEHLIKGGDFKALREDAIVHVQDLFDEAVDAEKKKTLLILLSMVDDISIYRSIESFQKQDTPIKPWATIALQQSRMLIQSNLLDESTVFVSTGLGGHDTLLRYFCVYVANEGVTLQPFQWDIAQKETELVISKSQGEIEQIEQFEKYITFTLLLPIEANLKEIFNSIIDECNTYGNFLSENIIITNVKKLSTKEIEDFLETKSPPKHKSRPF